MNVKCPFCGKLFERDSRALLENKYCKHCIKDRIEASGGKTFTNPVLEEVTPGYLKVKEEGVNESK